MSDINLDIDASTLRDFDRALDVYQVATGKDSIDVVNRAGKNIAYRAPRYTPKADKAAIQAAHAGTGAARILAARIRRAGKKPPTGAAWALMVKQFHTQTLRSIAFIKSGWLPAAKKFEALYPGSIGVSTSKMEAFGRTEPDIQTKNPYPQIGDAIGARTTTQGVEAELANQSVNVRNRTSEAALERYGAPGLDLAMQDVAQDMTQFAEERLGLRAKEFSKE